MIFVAFLVLGPASPGSSAEDRSLLMVTGSELIAKPQLYEDRLVSVTGEVIGEVMKRGELSWINLKNGDAVIGVLVPTSMIPSISYAGNYHYRGDTIEVVGIFRHSDPGVGGEFSIRADRVAIIESGYRTEHELSPTKVRLAWSMFGITAFLLVLRLVVPMKERQKQS